MLSLLLLACQPTHAPPHPQTRLDIVELDVATAQDAMASGRLSAVALTWASLDRIAAIDETGPTLNAVITLNPNAVTEAEALDAERAAGKVRGPLHGVPVLIKDNIDVAGLVTSAGSLAMASHRPSADAPLVARLRAAGAVILGKTNLSEWANLRSTRSTSGWSSLGGLTRNPYVLDRNACGSSSGTGAAIAASLALLGVGTETDGSILCPSAINGLVGLKPTVGRISQQGIVPISASQDTAGPMARTVADAAALYAVLADVPPVAFPPHGLQGKRLGVLRQATGTNPALDAVFEASLQALRTAGAELVDPVQITTWDQWNDPELELLLYEFKDGLNRYLAEGHAPIASLEALITWNQANAPTAMPYFGQELLIEAQKRGPLSDPAYLQAHAAAQHLAGEAGLFAALQQNQLDAVVAPATGPAWTTDLVNGDHFGSASWGAAAVAGSPSLTVPMGQIQGLPVGIVFMAAPNAEDELLMIGHGFEEATHARRTPLYQPSLER